MPRGAFRQQQGSGRDGALMAQNFSPGTCQFVQIEGQAALGVSSPVGAILDFREEHAIVGAATYQPAGRGRLSHPALTRRDGMRIGALSFAYGDIMRFTPTMTVERDWNGQMACAVFYGTAAALFLMGILLGTLDMKYMIAVVFLGAVCFMSAGDVRNTPTVTLYRLDITLRDGRCCRFLDADPRVVDEIAARIDAAGGIRT
jgi:hypothetical protein